MEKFYTVSKNKTMGLGGDCGGADCGSDHELLVSNSDLN